MKDGGPAFPASDSQIIGKGKDAAIVLGQFGMTLRDYFAAAALQGLLASANLVPKKGVTRPLHIEATVAAYEVADAMLVEREES